MITGLWDNFLGGAIAKTVIGMVFSISTIWWQQLKLIHICVIKSHEAAWFSGPFFVAHVVFILVVTKHTSTDWDLSNVPDASGTF